ncbi:NAD kinase [Nigerium massiliense]|uniref:NAD kinase n=1 Tax=Nigerium massiliense TaxID=1522317 RepID=UPI00058F4D04|nr:NAD kinase [Nigerium massiliense]
MTQRNIAISVHTKRQQAVQAAVDFISAVSGFGVECWLRTETYEAISADLGDDVTIHELRLEDDRVDLELVVVFGGDGTILRAAEWAVPAGVPILGVNLGHVGFLAELEPSQFDSLIRSVVEKRYTVEERLCLDVRHFAERDGEPIWQSFAINEVSLEKAARERMIEVLVEIDNRPLQRWGTDGVLVSTPTGSTAYAFSAQGPVLWPDLEALLVVPLLAHALFARPLVLSPHSEIAITMLPSQGPGGVLWCDGRRSTDAKASTVVRIRRSDLRLKLARLDSAPFVERLVRKFELPVAGWRGSDERSPGVEMGHQSRDA